MTHLPYIAASYALGILLPVGYGLQTWLRSARARRRLLAIDPRQRKDAV